MRATVPKPAPPTSPRQGCASRQTHILCLGHLSLPWRQLPNLEFWINSYLEFRELHSTVDAGVPQARLEVWAVQYHYNDEESFREDLQKVAGGAIS